MRHYWQRPGDNVIHPKGHPGSDNKLVTADGVSVGEPATGAEHAVQCSANLCACTVKIIIIITVIRLNLVEGKKNV